MRAFSMLETHKLQLNYSRCSPCMRQQASHCLFLTYPDDKKSENRMIEENQAKLEAEDMHKLRSSTHHKQKVT